MKRPGTVALLAATSAIDLRAVGQWRGKPVAIEQPGYRDPQERTALLVQQRLGGPIIVAARI
jgi:hypothetical protein